MNRSTPSLPLEETQLGCPLIPDLGASGKANVLPVWAPVCGALLWQPWETNTETITGSGINNQDLTSLGGHYLVSHQGRTHFLSFFRF